MTLFIGVILRFLRRCEFRLYDAHGFFSVNAPQNGLVHFYSILSKKIIGVLPLEIDRGGGVPAVANSYLAAPKANLQFS
jgi:hypothetical protein